MVRIAEARGSNLSYSDAKSALAIRGLKKKNPCMRYF